MMFNFVYEKAGVSEKGNDEIKEEVREIACTLAAEKEGSAVWVVWEGMKPPPAKAALPSNWLPYISALKP